MASFGKIEEFSPEKETISNYLERVELFFQANDIADDKKMPIFLSIVGGNVYALLRNHLSPIKPQEKSVADLTAELKKHYEPKRVVIAEWFNFHWRNQASDESISDYIAELRKLAINCDFGDYLEESLRDRFVCGLRNETTQKQLLTEADLTFKRAVDIAKGNKAVDKKSQQLQKPKAVDVSKVTHNSQPVRSCYRCGKEGHSPSACHFKDIVCRNCRKKGHIAKVCRSAKQKHPSNVRKHKRKTGTMNALNNASEDSESDFPVLKLSLQVDQLIWSKWNLKFKGNQ